MEPRAVPPDWRASKSRSGKILTIFSGFVFMVAVVVFAAAWYYAGAIKDQALAVEREQDRFDLRVVSIEGARITLEADAETASSGRWGEPGIWGLEAGRAGLAGP